MLYFLSFSFCITVDKFSAKRRGLDPIISKFLYNSVKFNVTALKMPFKRTEFHIWRTCIIGLKNYLCKYIQSAFCICRGLDPRIEILGWLNLQIQRVYCKVLGTSIDILASMRCGVVCPGVESPWIPRDGCINVIDFYLPCIPLCLRTILQYC